MDADYIANLEAEVSVLHDRVAELEAELTESRENLRIALERKFEEVSIRLSLVSVYWVYVPQVG